MWSWNSQPDSNAQRKFIELIYKRTGKYANWDPPSEIRVGSYGRIGETTGNLIVEGNIYDDEFKQRLIDAGINIESGEHLAEDCPEEVEFSTWSKNVKKLDLPESHAGVPGIVNAAIKGSWEVKKGTTGAVLLMHNPRIRHITSDALGKIARIELFKEMHLITKVFYCPAFSLYLSDKSGEKFSMALLGSAPVAVGVAAGRSASMTWWSDTGNGLSRRGCKEEHCFTPLYELMHVRHKNHRRKALSPERFGRDKWITPYLPWAPLDEEGNIVPIYAPQSDSSDEESE